MPWLARSRMRRRRRSGGCPQGPQDAPQGVPAALPQWSVTGWHTGRPGAVLGPSWGDPGGHSGGQHGLLRGGPSVRRGGGWRFGRVVGQLHSLHDGA